MDQSGGLEVVVVDDGSTDGTARRGPLAGADQVIVLPVNRGKGAAVRAGMLAARGRTLAFTDADLSYSPDHLVDLLEQVESGWDVVVGSRRHDDTTTLVRARRVREIGGRAINLLTRLVLLGKYRDTQCGLKAFRSDVARGDLRALAGRRVRLRRRGLPPGRALPALVGRGAGAGGQLQPIDRARGQRRAAHRSATCSGCAGGHARAATISSRTRCRWWPAPRPELQSTVEARPACRRGTVSRSGCGTRLRVHGARRSRLPVAHLQGLRRAWHRARPARRRARPSASARPSPGSPRPTPTTGHRGAGGP